MLHGYTATNKMIILGSGLRKNRPARAQILAQQRFAIKLVPFVGSTEASNGRLARVGVVGPTRASSWAIQRTTRLALGAGKRQCRVHDRRRQGRPPYDPFDERPALVSLGFEVSPTQG